MEVHPRVVNPHDPNDDGIEAFINYKVVVHTVVAGRLQGGVDRPIHATEPPRLNNSLRRDVPVACYDPWTSECRNGFRYLL